MQLPSFETPGKKKSSAEHPTASGEIDPSKPEKAEDLRVEIRALEMQKAAAMGNIQEYEDKMREILNGPRDPNLQEINLQILNRYQEDKARQEKRYKELAMEIARKKVELDDLAN